MQIAIQGIGTKETKRVSEPRQTAKVIKFSVVKGSGNNCNIRRDTVTRK
jgi:hypothetical protein